MDIVERMRANIGQTCLYRRASHQNYAQRQVADVVLAANVYGLEAVFYRFTDGELAGPEVCWFLVDHGLDAGHTEARRVIGDLLEAAEPSVWEKGEPVEYAIPVESYHALLVLWQAMQGPEHG